MIETKVLRMDGSHDDINKIEFAAKVLREGGTVAFPTETVYGLGANALDGIAVSKIFEAKGRPSDNPLIVHIAEIEDVGRLAASVSESDVELMKKFWPGPISFVLPKSELIPVEVSAGLDTVGLRMPKHSLALQLIKAAGVPIAAPSANTSGRPSPTDVEHVIEDLIGKIDVIIDGGNCSVGLESTVLDLTQSPAAILRPGGVTKEELIECLGEIAIKATHISDEDAIVPKSPGMKYRHYSPNAKLTVVVGDSNEIVCTKVIELALENQKMGRKIGIMGTDYNMLNYKDFISYSLGKPQNPEEIAENLFKVLRKFDDTDVDLIIAESINTEGIGEAVMNRLCKAAGYNLHYAYADQEG